MSQSPADKISAAVGLRGDAEKVGGSLPPLLAEAERLAMTVAFGVHGRRRAGIGESFWQYRRAMPGDVMTAVDWRRSGRSDTLYIREKEWEAAQTVSIWADDAQSMDYRGERAPRTKRERAQLLALALAVLLVKAGERVSLLGTDAAQPRTGETQLRRIAMALADQRDGRPDYGAPPRARFAASGKAVFLSDFMGTREDVFPALAHAAERNVSGCYMQIVDDTEETFPFDGRTIFRSIGGSVEFETDRARALRDAYQSRLAERRAALRAATRATGWQFTVHHTSESPRKALLWLYMAIGGQA
ncbi:DUF58 domain-containing protein [Oceanibium sediminis]|uniref:DUF58 domain-containing protein n=1 Tax=Oceanibium sediminis TaxID=2026339 RepID=UPI001E635CB8|nr:DUF58 domain-containing protein [Oceanibium sediminis]